MADSSIPSSATAAAPTAVAVTGSAPATPFVPPAPVEPGSSDTDSFFSVVDGTIDLDDPYFDETHNSDASTEAEGAVEPPKAFQMLSIAAAAVSAAAAADADAAAAIAGLLFDIVPPAPLTAYVGLTRHSALSSNAVLGVSGALQNGYTRQADALAAFNIALSANAVCPQWPLLLDLEQLLDSLSLKESLHSDSPTESSLSSSSSSSHSSVYLSADEHATPPMPSAPPQTPPRSGAAFTDAPNTLAPPSTAAFLNAAKLLCACICTPHQVNTDSPITGRTLRTQLTPGELFIKAIRLFKALERPTTPSTHLRPSQLPLPITVPSSQNPLHCGKWYIVYKGITPGVYLSMLECGLHTAGISGSTYDSSADYFEASARYLHAEQQGHTHAYPAPVSSAVFVVV
ncbi:hypothetical protein C8F04DRAFT_1255823 [Mycena alexandri]|uniref:Uncharacterized protein n=1 Tax=Mycena alexandri TaxID=1745969 RepID=A0AAD6T4Z0_9AGAR|nr:hypothetical protein C8F04DRAFT_1255823 [Mycena alexandri]